jgi:ribosomal protein S14
MAKTGTWLMALGAFIVFVGLCFLPAAFGPDADRTMLGAGFVVVAMGLLLLSVGFYFKARLLSTGEVAATAPATAKRSRGKSACDQCGQDEPVIQCRVHQLHLCANCLGAHYDFRSCAYVPSTRRAVSSRSTAAAYSQTTAG